jgi:hypothetical protein
MDYVCLLTLSVILTITLDLALLAIQDTAFQMEFALQLHHQIRIAKLNQLQDNVSAVIQDSI